MAHSPRPAFLQYAIDDAQTRRQRALAALVRLEDRFRDQPATVLAEALALTRVFGESDARREALGECGHARVELARDFAMQVLHQGRHVPRGVVQVQHRDITTHVVGGIRERLERERHSGGVE